MVFLKLESLAFCSVPLFFRFRTLVDDVHEILDKVALLLNKVFFPLLFQSAQFTFVKALTLFHLMKGKIEIGDKPGSIAVGTLLVVLANLG